MLTMPQIYALAFANMAEIACKMGHFGSEEQFNIQRTQRVGYGDFFQQNFQEIILIPIRAN
jgi:hypothetical protein